MEKYFRIRQNINKWTPTILIHIVGIGFLFPFLCGLVFSGFYSFQDSHSILKMVVAAFLAGLITMFFQFGICVAVGILTAVAVFFPVVIRFGITCISTVLLVRLAIFEDPVLIGQSWLWLSTMAVLFSIFLTALTQKMK